MESEAKKIMLRFRAYFGLLTKDGCNVTDDQLRTFLDNTVAPVFPGFTTYRAHGYWKGTSEPTLIFETLDEPSRRADVDAIAREYARQFNQESVLVTQETIVSEFVRVASPVPVLSSLVGAA